MIKYFHTFDGWVKRLHSLTSPYKTLFWIVGVVVAAVYYFMTEHKDWFPHFSISSKWLGFLVLIPYLLGTLTNALIRRRKARTAEPEKPTVGNYRSKKLMGFEWHYICRGDALSRNPTVHCPECGSPLSLSRRDVEFICPGRTGDIIACQGLGHDGTPCQFKLPLPDDETAIRERVARALVADCQSRLYKPVP